MSPLGSRTSRWTPRATPDEAHGVVRALVGALVDVRDGRCSRVITRSGCGVRSVICRASWTITRHT